MAHCNTKQYGRPRAMTDHRVHRLFQHVVGPVNFVEMCAVQLDPRTNQYHDQGRDVGKHLKTTNSHRMDYKSLRRRGRKAGL